ncbi:DUF2851 family protein [candidate division KSB1 bacterium]|nr:DUF2851 family protein [candidate division KSB1 bacterium]
MDKIEEPAREGFLYHLWLDRQFESQTLRTIDGHAVEILEKGVRNYDSGPDFLNALIRIDAELERGDIEIHPIAGDWYAHGHHRDPRYNHVILHLVTMDCPPSFRTIRQDAALIPTLNLDNYLEKTAEELQVETDVRAQRFQCALALEDKSLIRQLVERAGDARFNVKKGRFSERRQNDPWNQLIYQSILEALGYSKNQIPFRRLAETVPIETLWSCIWNDPPDRARLKCEAYLFGAAGLLPSQKPATATPPMVKKYVEELDILWRHFPFRAKIDTLRPEAWQFFRLRPSNFPTRRIAAAATIAVRFATDGFIGTFVKAIADVLQKPLKVCRELERLFVMPYHDFWSHHFSFEESKSITAASKDSCLLGEERSRDIIVNVVLPALVVYAEEAHDYKLKNVILETYTSYPLLTENDLTRQMCEQIFATPRQPDIITGARMQQGLIHLKKEMCRPEQCDVCIHTLTE